MDKDHGLPSANIKVRHTMVLDYYRLERNPLDEFNPGRERWGRGTSHGYKTPYEDKGKGSGQQAKTTRH
jgi:hypothetical protein